MKRISCLTILLASVVVMASAQNPPPSAASAGAHAATQEKPAVPPPPPEPPKAPAEIPATPISSSDFKLPAGIPPLDAAFQTAFSLRYQDITVGTGPIAEPNKLYHVQYTGWLASNGTKFDSSYDHPASPIIGKDGKPETGDDGKPKTAPGQPLLFPQGMHRMLPGFDEAFGGMHIGGKRRIYIPWQLAYGAQGRPSNDPTKPGIPEKADLIFDVELVDVTDIPERPHPQPPPPNKGSSFPFKHGMPPGVPPPAGASTPDAKPAPGAPGAPSTPPAATPAPAK